jgi:hypothetical protein
MLSGGLFTKQASESGEDVSLDSMQDREGIMEEAEKYS